MIELLIMAVALAMDATAAAASIGAAERSLRPVLVGAGLFGAFQAGMSGMGWWGGVQVGQWAAAWDHWVAFVLLALIGSRTIYEGLKHDEAAKRAHGFGALVVLALATSIDALAAGVTLPLLEVPALVAVASIGVVTGVLSLVGGLVGRSLGDRFGPKLDVLGGLVLVGLGVKILAQHLSG